MVVAAVPGCRVSRRPLEAPRLCPIGNNGEPPNQRYSDELQGVEDRLGAEVQKVIQLGSGIAAATRILRLRHHLERFGEAHLAAIQALATKRQRTGNHIARRCDRKEVPRSEAIVAAVEAPLAVIVMAGELPEKGLR